MKKRISVVLLMLGIFASGCGAAEIQGTVSVSEHEVSFSFDELDGLYFYFASGAGAWRTELEIDADGSFSGVHSDSDMGDVGEGYPNGTFYICEFDGVFTQPEKVNEYTYSVQMDDINFKNEPGTQEILDGVRYSYSTAYGLDGAEEVLIYLPGAPFMELPEEYRNWVRNDMVDPKAAELPFYGLYNVNEQNGFSSHSIVGGIHEMVSAAEVEAAAAENSLKQAMTQLEMNERSAEIYAIWDDLLNDLWTELKESLPEEAFQDLLEEQRAWIREKEQAVEAAGDEYAGGSMQPMVRNMKAAELTKVRVYELYEVLEKSE